jgi:hypothetical protein
MTRRQDKSNFATQSIKLFCHSLIFFITQGQTTKPEAMLASSGAGSDKSCACFTVRANVKCLDSSVAPIDQDFLE